MKILSVVLCMHPDCLRIVVIHHHGRHRRFGLDRT